MLAYKARMIVDYDSWKNSRDEIIIYEEIDKKAVCQVNDIRGWGQSTVEIDGEDYKILWLYIFINDWKTTPEYIEDIVMSACKALDIKEFISYTVDEIELLTENRITCFSFRNNQLCEKTQCEELFSYVSGNGSFMLDWVIKDNLNKKQNFELCKNTLHAADLNRELKKIYTNSKNKSNVENGSPVNYILQGYNTYGFKDSLEVLLSSLKDANRLSSNHVYKFSFDKLCEVHADYALYRYRDFEAFCDSLNDSLGASLNGNIVVIEYGLHDTDTNFDTQNYTAFQRFVNALKPYMEHTPVIFTIPDGNPDIVRRIHKLVDLPIADILIDRDFDPRGRSFTENYKYLKDKAHKQGIVPDEKLKTMLKTEMDDNTLENIDDLFFNWKTQKRIEDDYPQYIYEMQKVMKLKGQKEPDAMIRLDQLIGLEPVKKQIKDILTRIKMEKELKRQGLPIQEFSKHMVFLGNPGTGKSEVAHLIGQILKDANVLKEGRVLTISGANVHSNWDKIFARAKNNVLFIDEAYDLYENADNLASLVANLENHRNETIVIFAGYKEAMERMMSRNVGFRSRIGFKLTFPDYSKEELLEIFKLMIRRAHLKISDDALKIARDALWRGGRRIDQGNGRYVRKYFEDVVGAQQIRLAKLTEKSNHVYTKEELSTILPEDLKVEDTKEDGLKTLDELIGLNCVKKTIKTKLNSIIMQKMRRDKKLKGDFVPMHMAFIGNPGTGKTEVARLIGKILADAGVLSRGEFIECHPGQICGPDLIDELFQKCRGSVLFIDEAYALSNLHPMVLASLLKNMEDYREEVVVIFAGYTAEINELLDSNPGFKSRISQMVFFDDYSEKELVKIGEYMAKQSDYKLSKDAKVALEEIIKDASGSRDFGNARFVRKVIEAAGMAQSDRLLLKNTNPTVKEMCELTAEDFKNINLDQLRKSCKTIGFNSSK